jgi:aminomethyltransferase
MNDSALRRTALHSLHIEAGARMVPFAGWEMPLHYGSQLKEHGAVRTGVGLFDVSHMAVIDVDGAEAKPFLRRMIANDVERLAAPGKALYGVLLNPEGGIIDDVIACRRDSGYRVVSNAATRARVLEWLVAHAGSGVRIDVRDLAMIAVQGPAAVECFVSVRDWPEVARLGSFSAAERDGWMVSRTGYTGEDGLEVILPPDEAVALWRDLMRAGAAPAGLGARDTLRLEAGLNLYGKDMDETTSPLVSNIAWTVAWQPADRAFIGREALEAERAAGIRQQLTGLVLEERGVLRHDQRVHVAGGEGWITSGIFSPTLGYSIALARLPRAAQGECQVELRGQLKPARIVKPPFVRHGRKVFE